jgi:arabinose-5-phosphate isomerase
MNEHSDDATIIERGRRVVRIERDALVEVENRLGKEFACAVRLIAESRGRVIVSGVGKSGHIGRKIAATFSSTGTTSLFLHPVEALHGDLGVVGPDDVAILISKSGETKELVTLLDHLKRFGVRTLALVGETKSSLGRYADVAIDAWVREEACPHDLAPTTSTTAALVIGDALAIALLEERGFRPEDFARLHPGGSLGRRLLLTVGDVMVRDHLPLLKADATMRDAVVLLAERRGIVAVVDGDDRVAGVLTTGDLTRLMEHEDNVWPIEVKTIMNRKPKLATASELAGAAMYRMQEMGIIAMPVIDGDRRVEGVIHLHDIMRAGAA